jgi:hypothetical protein
MIHYTSYRIDDFTFYIPLESGFENPVYFQKAYQLNVIGGDEVLFYDGPDPFSESPPPWHFFVTGGIITDVAITKDKTNLPDSGPFNGEYPSPAALAAVGCAYYSSPGINQLVYDSSLMGMTVPAYVPVIRRQTRRNFASPIPASIAVLLLAGVAMCSNAPTPPARRRRKK